MTSVRNDFFAIFGIPETLDLDVAALQKRFYELSREHHPDRKKPSERAEAEQRTSELNDAWRTLRDPIKRAHYVLERHHLNLQPTPDILEEMFELNMEREEAETRDQLEAIHRRLLAMLQQTDQALAQSFTQDLSAVRAILSKRQYIQNLIASTENALSN
ncbi:MAG: Fe-S protein assembly co-chaperone HscB [Acidobacteria bacterium]|nr:Fe-S protein assembly co-chaperone HscB [Acidobacteriota bacterium]